MVIQSRVNPPDWTDEAGGGDEGARCRNFSISRDAVDNLVRDDVWFQDAEEALPVCNGDFIGTPCPLRQSCLFVALVNNDQHGVFGGLTAPQRRWIRRNVPRDRWGDDVHLREIVPDIDYFANYGNEDPESDRDEFIQEQEEQARLREQEEAEEQAGEGGAQGVRGG